ncbi:acyltransferase [Clostridium cuniculi]|uniref:acyltransferase n=1 Tax=Clostridium cuniculi TaxID=2548455 RepID=UPI0010550957|nr:acyltransferase [Clostridium cuniculi]
MNIKRILSKVYLRIKLNKLKRQGVKLGKNISITGKLRVGSEGYLVEIGDDVTIAGADILTHDGGIRVIRKLEGKPNLKKQGTVSIMNNSFIGKNSIILPNISIGPNSIVGCGSVVTKNVPPNTVYAGNPAKYICSIEEYKEKCLILN